MQLKNVAALRLLRTAGLAVLLACAWSLGGSLLVAGAAPVECRIGTQLTSLRNFDYAANSFDAEFWIWAVCPTNKVQPLKTAEFVSSNSVSSSLYSIEHIRGVYWSQEKVEGTFRYNWNLQSYPFDRHDLDIGIEDADSDNTQLRYVPDTANSDIDTGLDLSHWKLSNFQISSRPARYYTTYGDPSLPPGSGSTYSHLDIKVRIQRADVGELFLLISPVLAAVALGIIPILLPTESVTDRVALIGAGLFVVVINLQSSSSNLSVSALSVVGGIHVLALVFLLGFGVYTLRARKSETEEEEGIISSRARRNAIITSAAYISLVAIILGVAAYRG